jgi:2-dehydro-3-deoxy-D-arabinonate dehydratase
VTVGFVRVLDPARGRLTAVTHDGRVYDLSGADADIGTLIRTGQLNDPVFLAWVRTQMTEATRYDLDYDALWRLGADPRGPRLLMPYDPPEVWGVGVSYARTAELHEEDLHAQGTAAGLYAYVLHSRRPEIFFKGVARHCVGHREAVTIRGDSQGTTIEPELACVLSADGTIVAYTVANDVTAWDLEKESPLFLSYAKIFVGSCALGPVVVPAALVDDPLRLGVRCRVERGARVLYEGEGSTRGLRRSLAELSRYLAYCNALPDGVLLCTGSAIGIPHEVVLEDGDLVTISIDGLGTLCNVARRSAPPDYGVPGRPWEATGRPLTPVADREGVPR